MGEYDNMMDQSRRLIESLLTYHCDNVRKYNGHEVESSFEVLRDHNRNARCFIAVEIENRVSRKHLLGGAVNASALGRIGIAIGWGDDKVKALVKLREYWDFLASVGKNTFSTKNLLILNPQQLQEALVSTVPECCRT